MTEQEKTLSSRPLHWESSLRFLRLSTVRLGDRPVIRSRGLYLAEGCSSRLSQEPTLCAGTTIDESGLQGEEEGNDEEDDVQQGEECKLSNADDLVSGHFNLAQSI